MVGTGVAVLVGDGVGVGVGTGVGVLVGDGMLIGVGVGVPVGVAVGVGVLIGVGVLVGKAAGTGVQVGAGVGVYVGTGVQVGAGVQVGSEVGVQVGSRVQVGAIVGVGGSGLLHPTTTAEAATKPSPTATAYSLSRRAYVNIICISARLVTTANETTIRTYSLRPSPEVIVPNVVNLVFLRIQLNAKPHRANPSS